MDQRLLNSTRELWDWFSDNANLVASQLDESSEEGLPPALKRLDSLIGALGESLSWEIGPHKEGLFLAISPGGDTELFPLTKEIVALAKAPRSWSILAAKPPKDWNRSVLFADKSVDASRWNYRIHRREDGRLGIIWEFPVEYELSKDDLQSLGWLVLESELGEATVLERFVDVEMCPLHNWPDDAQGRPIHRLWSEVEQLEGAAPRQQ